MAEKVAIPNTLAKNHDLFAWTTTDMLRIDPRVISHRMVLSKEAGYLQIIKDWKKKEG